jgi:hypothetical protein
LTHIKRFLGSGNEPEPRCWAQAQLLGMYLDPGDLASILSLITWSNVHKHNECPKPNHFSPSLMHVYEIFVSHWHFYKGYLSFIIVIMVKWLFNLVTQKKKKTNLMSYKYHWTTSVKWFTIYIKKHTYIQNKNKQYFLRISYSLSYLYITLFLFLYKITNLII